MRKNLFRMIAVAVLALAVAVVPSFAQTALTATTLSEAVNATQRVVVVASATGVTAGKLLVVDNEAMLVQSITSTSATVQRGVSGTAPGAHASGEGVLVGTPSQFFTYDVIGACTAANTVAPHVNLVNGNRFSCLNSRWVRYRDAGYPVVSIFGASGNTATDYADSGAITIAGGLVSLSKGSAQAMTLANPSVAQNGLVIQIYAATAQAHTVTLATGLYGGTTAEDVGTFGGAIGDSVTLMAYNGVWIILSVRNVTFA